MTTSAAKFAAAFEARFRAETSSSPFNEIEQFRAMMRSFGSLRPKFYLEEFHGFKRQVYFNTVHPWMRDRARCELCDILLIIYGTNGGLSVRMSLLQVKLSRTEHFTSDPSYTGKIEPQTFSGNYEQWDLLSRRPKIEPTTVFVPPPDLLSSATLSTIGTFGIFFKNRPGVIDLFYAAADCLTPDTLPRGPKARLGKLKTVTGPATRQVNGWNEATYCPSAYDFAHALFQLEIGNPIFEKSAAGISFEQKTQLNWARAIMTSHLAESSDSAPITRALLEEIGSSDPLPKDSVIPSLLVLRGKQTLVKEDEIDV